MSQLAPGIGIDIGGSTMAAGLVAPDGQVLARAESRTPAREGAERILDMAVELAVRVRGDHHVRALGVGSAGVIRPGTGQVAAATDLISGWAGTDLAAIDDRINADGSAVPLTVVNDVHAHGVGEARAGAGAGRGAVLTVAVGTGLGGAVIQHGLPLVGAHGAAGHFGHVPAPAAGGLPCSCGMTGHLEAVASGYGLLALYRRHGGDATVQTARELAERLNKDPLAHRAVVDSATALGEGIGAWVSALDPDVVIMSGGVSRLDDVWWDRLRETVRTTTLPFLRGIEVVPGTLGADAPIVGAALLALDAA